MCVLHLILLIFCCSFLNHAALSVTLLCIWAVNQMRKVIWVKNNPATPPDLDRCIYCVTGQLHLVCQKPGLGQFPSSRGCISNWQEFEKLKANIYPSNSLKWKQKSISPALSELEFRYLSPNVLLSVPWGAQLKKSYMGVSLIYWCHKCQHTVSCEQGNLSLYFRSYVLLQASVFQM